MSGEITKESLDAFTEATKKSAAELESIVNALGAVGNKLDKVVDKITNGMTQEIIDGVSKNYNSIHKETIDTLDRIEECAEFNKTLLIDKVPEVLSKTITNSTISKDVEHVKWLVSIVGVVVIIVSVLLRILGTSTINNESKLLQHLLEQHITQTERNNVSTMSKM